MLVRKTWDALHTKHIFAAFPLFIANADKIQTPGAFNRNPLLWHPYTLTFALIPYTLKTLERYFPGLIENIRVCGPSSGFSFVIRFATKSILQNIHALVVVIHTPTHVE